MAKYSTLKAERDDAVERAVIAERNSQLERVRELEAAHAAAIAVLRTQIEQLEIKLLNTREAFESAIYGAQALLRSVSVEIRGDCDSLASDSRHPVQEAVRKDDELPRAVEDHGLFDVKRPASE